MLSSPKLPKFHLSLAPAGEGKTIVALLPTFLAALEDKGGVYVVTPNDYLAATRRTSGRSCASWDSPLDWCSPPWRPNVTQEMMNPYESSELNGWFIERICSGNQCV